MLMADETRPRNVVEALLLVKRKMDALGVGKERRVQEGPARYAYRSVDDVINAVGPMLTEAGVVTTITYRDHGAEDVTIVSQKGTRHAHRVTLRVVVRFTHCAEDGSVSSLETEAIGEGLDSGDKATNKAMSIAYKYALGLALPIPFVGRDDPDAEQPILAGPATKQPLAQPQQQSGPAKSIDVGTYMSRIALCQDINVLRGIVKSGMAEAAEAGDMAARAKIRDAGTTRAAMIEADAKEQAAEMDRAFKETIAADGEVA